MITGGKYQREYEGRSSQGVWDGYMNTVIFKMDNQQGPCVAQESLLNVMCQPGWEGYLRENGFMYIYG